MAQLSLSDELIQKLQACAEQEHLSVEALLSNWVNEHTQPPISEQVDDLTYYKTIFTHAHDAILIIDEDENYIDANPAACAMLGYTLEELQRLTTRDITPPDFVPEFEHLKTQFHTDGSIRTEYPILRKDGQIIETEFYSVSSFLPGKRLAIVRDITQRKQAEARLAAQRNFFREIIDRSDNLIYVKRADGYNVLVNQSLAELYNTTPQERIGKYDSDYIIDAERLERSQASDRRIIETGQPEVIPSQRIQIGTAEPRWYRIQKTPIPAEDGSEMLILAVATDITEQKEAKERLAAQRNFFREIIDRIDSLIYVKRVDGYNVLVNKSIADLYNTTPGERTGTYDSDYVIDSDRIKQMQASDRRIIETGEAEIVTAQQIEMGNAGLRWYRTRKAPIPSEDGSEMLILAVATDITEQKEAEEALRESEHFLRTIYDNTDIGVFVVAVREDGDFVIVGTNLVNSTSLPFNNMDILNKRPEEITNFSPEVAANMRANYQRCVDARNTITFEEETNIQGISQWWLTTLTPLFDAQGRVYRIIGFSMDITERKQAEQAAQQMKLLELQLVQAQQLQDFQSRILAMIAHEFRTPIAVTKTSLYLLRRKLAQHLPALDEFERYFDRIEAQEQRLTGMVDDVVKLNDFTITTPKPLLEPISIKSFFHQIIDEAQLSSLKKAQIMLEVHGDALHEDRLGDAELLRRIVTNLVSNAIKYSTDNQTVQVTCHCTIDTVTISVQDNGIGIPEAEQAHIFETFYRGESVTNLPGTGLGLAIVKQSVEAFNGSITFNSTENEGTTFTVILPMALAGEHDPNANVH